MLLRWFLCVSWARLCRSPHLPHGLYVSGPPPDISNALQDPLEFFSWVAMDIVCNSKGVRGCYDGFFALHGLGYAVFITCPMVFSSPDLLQASEISYSALYNNYFSFPGMLFVVFHTKRVAMMVFFSCLGYDMSCFLYFAAILGYIWVPRARKWWVTPPFNIIMSFYMCNSIIHESLKNFPRHLRNPGSKMCNFLSAPWGKTPPTALWSIR